MIENAEKLSSDVLEHATRILDTCGLTSISMTGRAVTLAVMDCYEAAYKAGADRALEMVREQTQ